MTPYAMCVIDELPKYFSIKAGYRYPHPLQSLSSSRCWISHNTRSVKLIVYQKDSFDSGEQ